MTRVVGILLAAGQSRRFGRNKCLTALPDGIAMGLRCAQNLSQHVDDMVCIIPPDTPALDRLFSAADLNTVICWSAHQGMSQSLKAGVNYFAADSRVSAFMIALADMPLINASTYQTIALNLVARGGIVRPTHQEKSGHPVGFDARFTQDLQDLRGDQGARVLFQKYAKHITLISTDDPGIHQDFDTLSTFEHYFNERTR